MEGLVRRSGAMSLCVLGLLVALGVVVVSLRGGAQTLQQPLLGRAAFGDWRDDAPGTWRHIRPQDLPAPARNESAANSVRVVRAPEGAHLRVPAGFDVEIFANDLSGPRAMQVAPNGDVFVAESRAGRIRVLRPSADASSAAQASVFASGLREPIGMAFYPAGPNPEWLYVANTDSVVRFHYRDGELETHEAPDIVVAHLPSGRGHWTRDLVFSKDGSRMFVSVGSGSNVAENLDPLTPHELEQWKSTHAMGAAWGTEQDRADVLVFDPQGKNGKVFATGLRNCVGMAVHPLTGDLWCSTNERDALGDNLPPDYVTRVREGAFYGWPWYYIGANEDPRQKNVRPDLKDQVTIPDVLIEAHSASMQIAFDNGNQFPEEYRGDGFVAEHGSWNRSNRTGYKVIRIKLKDGVPTGEYEDFVTGFAINDESVWGRPFGVTFMKDGSMLISEDGHGTIWRVSHRPE
jgi:glucose/arabinose dehydrogenase